MPCIRLMEREMSSPHLSSCALFNEPAMPSGACNCGTPNLLGFLKKSIVSVYVSDAGKLGFFINCNGANVFFDAEKIKSIVVAEGSPTVAGKEITL